MTASDDRATAEGHQLGDRLLDLLFYAPAGLLVTVADELPDLAAKGRGRLGLHLRNAQIVGRFAVGAARRQVHEQVDGLIGERARNEALPVPPPAAPSRPGTAATPRPRTENRRTRPAAGAGGGRDDAVDRAIPDYDTLSASQVVRRLDGLSADELRAVARHETGTRGRRTILHRAEQLLGAPPPPDTGARP